MACRLFFKSSLRRRLLWFSNARAVRGRISPVPTSSIGHAHPCNEWNSRNLGADKHLKRVAYSQRRRGDLVFYYQPGTHTIWHVAIYLGNNRVIESWPPCAMVAPISNSQRNVIAGIKRPFI